MHRKALKTLNLTVKHLLVQEWILKQQQQQKTHMWLSMSPLAVSISQELWF